MNFVVIIATMAAFWHGGSTVAPQRQGKFFSLSDEDMLSDILDEINDPLPLPKNTLSIRDYVLHKINQKNANKKATSMPPISIPEQIVYKLTTPAPTVSPLPNSFNKSKRPVTNKPKPEPLILYDSSTSTFEVTPAGFASHPQPVTEGMFVIGGQFEQTESPQNMTVENLRIFWSSLGDFIESVPFLPIQVNVPDLLSAMASFFSQRLPFLNRNPSQSEPRPNNKVQEVLQQAQTIPPSTSYFPIDSNLLEYRRSSQPVTDSPKKRKKNKKKIEKKKTTTTENTKLRGLFTTEGYKLKSYFTTESPKPRIRRRSTTSPNVPNEEQKQKYWLPSTVSTKKRDRFKTTESPSDVTAKAWFHKPTERVEAKVSKSPLKLFSHNMSPGSEYIRYNHVPIIRKVNRFKDREIFNFKNSDISNSPIMILNMPNRHVFFHKYNLDQKTDMPLFFTSDKSV